VPSGLNLKDFLNFAILGYYIPKDRPVLSRTSTKESKQAIVSQQDVAVGVEDSEGMGGGIQADHSSTLTGAGDQEVIPSNRDSNAAAEKCNQIEMARSDTEMSLAGELGDIMDSWYYNPWI
jgi:hypothetical protein